MSLEIHILSPAPMRVRMIDTSKGVHAEIEAESQQIAARMQWFLGLCAGVTFSAATAEKAVVIRDTTGIPWVGRLVAYSKQHILTWQERKCE